MLGLVFPEVIGKGRVIILYEEPRAAKGMLRVDKAAIATLPKIPPVSTVEDARDMLSEKREDATVINNKTRVPGAKMPWGVQISNFGFITIDAIPLLLGVFDIKDFARKLQHMLEWIQGPVSKIDKVFSSYIVNILRHQPGIMTHTFNLTPTLRIYLRSLLDFAWEEYINDDIVSGIIHLFGQHYGSNGQYLFIPHLTLQGWQGNTGAEPDWEWEREQMKKGKIEKIFAITYMGQHWGAFSIDLYAKSIKFGDSLHMPVPKKALQGIKRWLEASGLDLATWNITLERFDVPTQPSQSGSCSINAANAIEQVVNKSITRWTHDTATYHRVRFLKALIGYAQVRIST